MNAPTDPMIQADDLADACRAISESMGRSNPTETYREHANALVEIQRNVAASVRAERGNEPGKKYDAGKPPLSLIPREALEGLARVLDFGATKYGRYNWRAGMSWSRLIDAAMRHLVAFADGENRDPETGELHTAHVLACVAFLTTYFARGLGTDDRHGAD